MASHDIYGQCILQAAVSVLGGLDHLILNHATVTGYFLWDGSQGQLGTVERTLDVNFLSFVHLSSHALPYLKESNGSIAVINSNGGKYEKNIILYYIRHYELLLG